MKAKNRKKRTQKAVNLGREGTVARFIREQYLAGKETKTIYQAARRRFPEHNINGPGYVSWYRSMMRKDGVQV